VPSGGGGAGAGVWGGGGLRYFNVAGAGWDDLGDMATLNLIPMVLDRLAKGETPKIFRPQAFSASAIIHSPMSLVSP